MALLTEYVCDAPDCDNRVDVESERAKCWLSVSYIDPHDEKLPLLDVGRGEVVSLHYCSWECLSEAARIEAEKDRSIMGKIRCEN